MIRRINTTLPAPRGPVQRHRQAMIGRLIEIVAGEHAGLVGTLAAVLVRDGNQRPRWVHVRLQCGRFVQAAWEDVDGVG